MKKIFPLLFQICFVTNLMAQQSLDSIQYHFEWGALNLHTAKQPKTEPPERKSVVVEMKLSEAKKIIDHPIRLFKNGAPQKLKDFNITVFNRGIQHPPKHIQISDYFEKKASSIHGELILEKFLHPKSLLNVHFVFKEDSTLVALDFNVQVTSDNPVYRPEIKIPEIPKGEKFGFQIIMLEAKEKTILRIDTTNEATHHILKMYNRPDKYEIFHIPGFKTTRRFLTEVDFVEKEVHEDAVLLLADQSIADLDPFNYPEFTDFIDGKAPQMKWGEMLEPRNVDTNHSLYDLKDAIDGRFFISNGFQNLSIFRMRVTILPKDAGGQSFITNDMNHPELLAVLEKIESKTSIMFNEILIEGSEGQLSHLPLTYLFVVE